MLICKKIMQELKLVNKKFNEVMAIPKKGKGNFQPCQTKTTTKNVNRAVMKQQSTMLQKYLRIFLKWLFKTKQHLNLCLDENKRLISIICPICKVIQNNINVCLRLQVALSMMVKIYVIKHFLLHVVPVGDVKVNLGDAKYIFENSHNCNLKILFDLYDNILTFILKYINDNLFIFSPPFFLKAFFF